MSFYGDFSYFLMTNTVWSGYGWMVKSQPNRPLRALVVEGDQGGLTMGREGGGAGAEAGEDDAEGDAEVGVVVC